MHTSNGFVEVTQGLSAGNMLVVLGAEPLSDKAPVKVADDDDGRVRRGGAAPAAPPALGPPSGRVRQATAKRNQVGRGARAMNITDVCLRKPVLAWMIMARDDPLRARRRRRASA